ncbi:MAG TPA: hypothetical protein PLW65_20695 [Pseudomonadota bacterium]|nr:hypothetical protein [Pseudomonadota bacterium]
MLRFTLFSALLATAACGQSSPVERIDSSLKTPLKPGEAYSLARVTDDKYWISSIAVSDNYLFLATSWQGVYRMPKYGGALTAVEEDDKAVGRVAANRDTVFWNRTTFGAGDAPHTQVKQQPAAGGATSTLLEGDFGPFATNLYPTLVATGDALYMMRSDKPGDFSVRLDRLLLRDGTKSTLASFPDTGGSAIPWPTAWTLTGDHLYYTLNASLPRTVMDVKISSGSTTPLALDAPISSGFLAADATGLYSDLPGRTYGLAKISPTDGAVRTLHTSPDLQLGSRTATVAIDADNIYLLTHDDKVGNQIQAAPKAGGAPTVIGSGSQFQFGVDQFLQDDDNLFVLHEGHEVLLLPKKPGAAVP